jgi:hypothetical protein
MAWCRTIRGLIPWLIGLFPVAQLAATPGLAHSAAIAPMSESGTFRPKLSLRVRAAVGGEADMLGRCRMGR